MEKDARDLILEDALKVAIEETRKRKWYEKLSYFYLAIIIILTGVFLCNF